MNKSKQHTTNYKNTFIEVAEDCPVEAAEIPPVKAEKTAANIQFEMIIEKPYTFTSDDVLFHVFAIKNGITSKQKLQGEREIFFSKGQACMRSSPLTKRYGWGVHHDNQGRVALYALESPEYKKLCKDKSIAHVKAMRSKKK